MRKVVALVAAGFVACQPADAPKPTVTPVVEDAAPPPVPLPASAKATFDADHTKAAASNPSDLHFGIALAAGKTRFLQGEPIAVELAFSSDVPKKYKLDKGLYDRIGRLSCDAWILDRTDTVDPLAEYFANGFGGMGGIRQMPILGTKPEKMTFEINEWHRFDHPGHYRLYVTSSRIELDGADGGRVDLAPTSNVVEFDVVTPTATDASRLLAAAIAQADSKNEDDRRKGARALRFLGTEGAAREMVRRFSDENGNGEWEFGLIGSPARAVALAAMEARLDEDAAIPVRFLHTVALLRDRTDDPTAKYDWPRRARLIDGYAARLAAGLAKKSATNRAVSAATALDVAWSDTSRPEPPYVATVMASLPLFFKDLPAAEQMRIVEYRWKRAKDPALAPALRDIYDDPKSTPDQREAMLHRLLEVDPPTARARILDHLRTGQPALGYRSFRSIGGLPDATLPALDSALADRMEKDPYAMAEVGRYATAAILPRVKRVYSASAGSFATEIEGQFLGYFLRVDPAFGEKAAAALLLGKGSSAGAALKVAADVTMTPGLEKVLVSALSSANVETVIAAAEALEHHGSAAAQAPLTKRLEDFHSAWAGREADLAYSVTGGLKNELAVRLETALWRALVNGRGWLADKAFIAKVQSLVVRAQEREQVGYAANWWTGPVKIDLWRGDDGELRARVAQYEVTTVADLDAKLAQFPKATTFALGTVDAAEVPRIKAKLTALGMKLI